MLLTVTYSLRRRQIEASGQDRRPAGHGLLEEDIVSCSRGRTVPETGSAGDSRGGR